jgi:hypothetical protein
MNDALDFLVRRDDFRQTRFHTPDPASLEIADGEALLRVDHFALTANNVTYAAAGDMLDYWRFFPAEAGWGRIPVWGFGDVVASRAPGVAEGARFYGYYPMSTHLRVQPTNPGAAGFIDGADHRSTMAATYNQYRDVKHDPGYLADDEPSQMILQPLFTTGFLIDDALAESDFFGARRVVLSSASSKTAFSTAFQLAQRDGVEVIGLTSPHNVGFVEGLGCYGHVVAYDDISSLDAGAPAIYVDMAGDGDVLSAVHHHFGDALVHSLTVGMTHWERGKREEGLPGAAPTFFFAPTQVQKRLADWGAGGLQERVGNAFAAFRALSGRALRIVRGGRGDLERVYLDAVEGRTAADEGHILSLHE